MAEKYEQMHDGGWLEVHMSQFRHQCCDCGAVHDVKFRKLPRGLKVMFTRNLRATAAIRRARYERERDDA